MPRNAVLASGRPLLRRRAHRILPCWVTPWRGSTTIGQVVVPADLQPGADDLRTAIEDARQDGYTALVTCALPEGAAGPFHDVGFELRERLRLLVHPLTDMPGPVALPPGLQVERAHKRDRDALTELDDRSFDGFWRLGEAGLQDARDATPVHVVRVVRGPAGDAHRLWGAAITGLGGRSGYLQRLAVEPDARRLGIGRALVVDALHWLWERGASEAFVNTQVDNEVAVGLYRSCGFATAPGDLVVLSRSL
jgi:ribosomal protein S18 acetylase RimI-like enzyme